MSFNRLNYDSCSYKQVLFESIGPGNYQLGTPPINCDYCYPFPPTVRLQGTGVSIDRSSPLVDQHSELLNITRKASKCCEKNWSQSCGDCGWLSKDKYPSCQPNGICPQCDTTSISKPVNKKENTKKIQENFCVTSNCNKVKSKKKHFESCFVPQESSRLVDPPCNLRGTGIDRMSSEYQFEPCSQQNVLIPFDFNINNRLVAKDNHRNCTPSPIDQRLPLPPSPNKLPCHNIIPSCANFTSSTPMS